MNTDRNNCIHPTRRAFLAATGATGFAAFSAAGCDALSTEPEQKDRSRQDQSEQTQGKEPPQLVEKVHNGELPPLEDRIPSSPMVLDPVDRPGQYGGDWRYMLLTTGCITCLLERTIGYENLLRWKRDVRGFTSDELVPNVLEDLSGNDDFTEYTAKLRKDMKWSDGKPYLADDIVFWYEDVFSNTDLSPENPSWLVVGGEPLVVEKVDDYTVVFRFTASNGLFPQILATGRGLGVGITPAHYLKQFHLKHNDAVKQRAEKEGFDDWIALFQAKASAWENPDLPVLNPWILRSGYGADTQLLSADRNPYCWKVDSGGRQLPYIDRVRFGVVSNGQARVLKAAHGEIDHQVTGVDGTANKPVLARNRKKGDYHFVDNLPTYMNAAPLALNLTTTDPVKREVFNNKDFRIGLSYALKRQEIIDAAYARQGKPFQCAPRPESPFYHEKLAQQYLEYDPKAARMHLDRVMPDKDSDGMRLGPDGKPFSFSMDVATDEAPDDMVLIRRYWKAVGVGMSIKNDTFTSMLDRVAANQHHSIRWYGDGGLDVILDPRSYFPYNATLSASFIPWAAWYQQGGLNGKVSGETGLAEEPPEAAKEQMRLYDKLAKTSVPKEQGTFMRQILDIAAEQFWIMGVSLPSMGYGITKNKFFNVPKVLVSPGVSSNPGRAVAPQYFTTAD